MNKIESAYKEMMEDVQMSWLRIAYCMKDKALEIERELTAVTEQRDELLRYNEEFRKETLICADCDSISKEEYDRAIEQRDKIDSMYHKIIKEVLECDQIPACQREDDQLEPPWEVIARVREQRDRLAEALEHTMKHMRHSLNCPARLSEGLHACNCQMEWAYDNATEALQSLTTNEL